MNPSHDIPTPPELATNPELAAVALLLHTLEITIRSLIAAHPVITNPERPHWVTVSPSAVAAEKLIEHLSRVARSARKYAEVVASETAAAEQAGQGNSF